MTDSVEDRLRRLEAAEAIRALVARYALGADRKNDPAIMGPLFAETASWEAEGFARYEGRAAIARGLAEIAASRVLWTIHYMVSPLIEVDIKARTARCHWYLWELATMRGDDGAARDTWLGGWYDSRLALGEDGWKFTQVILDLRLNAQASPPWEMKKAIEA